MSFTNV